MWLSVYKLNCERNPPRPSQASTRLLFLRIAPEISRPRQLHPVVCSERRRAASEYKKAGRLSRVFSNANVELADRLRPQDIKEVRFARNARHADPTKRPGA